MRKSAVVVTLFLALLSCNISIAGASLSGTTCKKAGTVSVVGDIKFICQKSKSKLVWSKGIPIAKMVQPVPTVTPTPTPTPVMVPSTSATDLFPAMNSVTKSDPISYPNLITATDKSAGASTLVVPATLKDAPTGKNVKLWISDPRNPATGLPSSGIFYWAGNQAATYVSASNDGSLYIDLPSGQYSIDTVEGAGLASMMSRHRYSVTVSSNGNVSIQGLISNSNGVFAITTDLITAKNPSSTAEYNRLLSLATKPASSFIPTSPCQLIDAVTPTRSFGVDLSAGFPKIATRLPSYGHIRALIVPVDFTDIQGKDNTVSYFTPLAKDVRDFYFQESYGRISFDFSIIPNWVRMPFSSTKFGTGGSVGAGDPGGYLKAVISLTDPEIDYSKFDAIYFLVPKEMPMANMGWGPAITGPQVTTTGVVINGATGGADMYFNENNGIIGGKWKWMAHETGHAFGLYDEDNHHQTASLGNWDIMAMSWSNQAIEFGAWDRYLQGWLTNNQVGCTAKDSLSSAGISFALDPLVRQNEAQKSVMVPLTQTKILVMESRRNEGLDVLSSAQEGLLVYTVDMKVGQLGGGYIIQPRPGSSDKNSYTDAALHPGDSIIVEGVKITVTSATKDGDVLTLSK
jgi:M6 family metalloprotease-like protein